MGAAWEAWEAPYRNKIRKGRAGEWPLLPPGHLVFIFQKFFAAIELLPVVTIGLFPVVATEALSAVAGK